jgi:hypothetical protein
LRVDVDQNVDAILQIGQHRFAQRTVEVLVHSRVFQKITSIDSRMKIWRGKKSVIFAVNFTGPWHSRRARDGIKKLPSFSQSLNDSSFSRARWSGDEKENSVTCESHQIVILSEAKNLRLLLS